MNVLEELLVVTMEECGELIQQCSKVLRKRDASPGGEDLDPTSLEKLEREVGDVQCMIMLMERHGLIDHMATHHHMNSKLTKLQTWSKIAHFKSDEDKVHPGHLDVGQ